MSTTALEADHVLLVNRVKPHTDFHGRSKAAWPRSARSAWASSAARQTIHSYGTRGLVELMPRAARCIIDKTGKILGGLAIVENAHDETADRPVRRARRHRLRARGGAAARAPRSLIGALPFDALDVLIVDEMGKNISGTGMDTNVIGRMFVPGVAEEPRPRSPPSSCSV